MAIAVPVKGIVELPPTSSDRETYSLETISAEKWKDQQKLARMRAHSVILIAATIVSSMPAAGHFGQRVFPFYDSPTHVRPVTANCKGFSASSTCPRSSVRVHDATQSVSAN